MSMTNTAETEYLLHYFENEDVALIGDATGLRGSSTAGVWYISLHTANPGETGDQTTSEIAYTSYARISIARSAAKWTTAGNQSANTDEESFPEATGGGPTTATYFGIGTAASGAGKLVYYGLITSPAGGLIINTGTIPKFPAGTLVATAD